jgi:hypothetical protein
MSRSKRITAAAFVAGAIIGLGALPASAAESGGDRGHHYGQHDDGFRGDGWRHDRGNHYGQHRDGFRGEGRHHDRGHYNGR